MIKARGCHTTDPRTSKITMDKDLKLFLVAISIFGIGSCVLIIGIPLFAMFLDK